MDRGRTLLLRDNGAELRRLYPLPGELLPEGHPQPLPRPHPEIGLVYNYFHRHIVPCYRIAHWNLVEGAAIAALPRFAALLAPYANRVQITDVTNSIQTIINRIQAREAAGLLTNFVDMIGGIARSDVILRTVFRRGWEVWLPANRPLAVREHLPEQGQPMADIDPAIAAVNNLAVLEGEQGLIAARLARLATANFYPTPSATSAP